MPVERVEKIRFAVALCIGLAVHALLLLIPLTADPDNPAGHTVTVTLDHTPPPRPVPQRRAPPDTPLAALPAPPDPADIPPVPDDTPPPVLAEAPVAPEPPPPARPMPVTPAAPSTARPALSATRLMAEPLLEDGPTPLELFGPSREAPAPTLAYTVPERRGLDEMLETPLPELPFTDPELIDFMYAGDITGEAHRLFDKATPVFGWTSKTGFKIRCRFVLIAIGCGWGR